MSKANEFQIYAGECLSWAKSADTGEKRHQFLKLAQTWLRSAITAERQQISLDDPNNEIGATESSRIDESKAAE